MFVLHPLRFKTAPFGEIKNQKGLPFAERVNFDFGSSSKLPDDLLLLDKYFGLSSLFITL